MYKKELIIINPFTKELAKKLKISVEGGKPVLMENM